MEIIVYSKQGCSYCVRAKNLLDNLNLEFEERKLEDFSSTEALLEDIGKKIRTMPQIKIDGELIGGYNQLVEYFNDKGQVNFKGEIVSE